MPREIPPFPIGRPFSMRARTKSWLSNLRRGRSDGGMPTRGLRDKPAYRQRRSRPGALLVSGITGRRSCKKHKPRMMTLSGARWNPRGEDSIKVSIKVPTTTKRTELLLLQSTEVSDDPPYLLPKAGVKVIITRPFPNLNLYNMILNPQRREENRHQDLHVHPRNLYLSLSITNLYPVAIRAPAHPNSRRRTASGPRDPPSPRNLRNTTRHPHQKYTKVPQSPRRRSSVA